MQNLQKLWFVSLTAATVAGMIPVVHAAEPSGAAKGSAATSTGSTTGVSSSDHGGLGVGVIIGDPTGLSMKYWLSEETAVDMAAAWSFQDDGYFDLHSDFLFHKFDLIPVDKGELPLYFGVGGRIDVPGHGDTRLGVRIPVGLAYEFGDAPVEVFAEVAPIVDVVPATQLRWNGGIGVRFYFR
jgi:hypothetical protein